MNSYSMSELVQLTGSFTSTTGTPMDPTTIALKIKKPDGTVATYSYPDDLNKASTGVYRYNFVPSLSGVHYYRWDAGGSVQAAAESSFFVEPSNVV